MMISNMCHNNKLKHSHVLIIMLFLFQCVNSSTSISPSFVGNQLVAVANNGMNKQVMCIDKERRALLAFKADVQPQLVAEDDHDCFSTWGTKKEDDDDDCCNWVGVMCNNQTGHVTELYLNSCGLEGEISPSLFNLTSLTYLDLSGNALHGTVPVSIGSLAQLRYLDLSSNSFSGSIPRELGNLVNLESLHLNGLGRCSVENITWLSRLSHLEYLGMNGISLAKADHWVNPILSLQNLTVLHLDGCDLSQVMHPYSSSSYHVNSSSSSSNIVYLDLSNNNLNSSMYPWLYPLTSNTLETLDLSGNKLDEIPKYLGNLCSLKELYFTNNSALITFSDFLKTLSAGCTPAKLYYLYASSSQFTGSISDDIKNFSSLRRLSLAHTLLNGTISETLWELPMIDTLDISSNSFRSDIFEKNGKLNIRSNLYNLDLSSCKLGPRFPKWIQTFKNLTHINVANNGISDTIPVEFFDIWSFQLGYLNISSNNITGKAPHLFSNNFYVVALDFSSNSFYGPITNFSSSPFLLNLSKNKFYGGISFLCQIDDEYLTYLDLSHNSFSGKIPDCLWHFKSLKVLNLGHNNLSGRLPASVEYLIQLEVLYLYNNSLSGELPLSLRNCSMLTFLDLGANKFSGNLPVWIGEKLSGLYVLSLSSNDFSGPIPLQFCQLVNLQILDLSMNNLNGKIPSCVNNLTSMVHKGLLSVQNIHKYDFFVRRRTSDSFEYADHAMIQWQGTIREFTSSLGLLKSIDLSSNNLTGEIPNELTDLHGLLALNLSKNGLLGEIPRNIGQMKEVQILDLSCNSLSGGLPSTMSELNFLNYLDVSYNKLSGKIPSSAQLQSFEPSKYIGNAGLCGPPLLNKSCELQVPSIVVEREGGGEGGIDELERGFYICGAIGFAIGFWVVCSTLLVNRRGRHTFFRFMDSLEDWVYVKVVVFKAKLLRATHE